MSGTIEEFDDDTDFALPAPPAAASGSGAAAAGGSGGAPPGMDMGALQQMMAQMQGGGGGGGGSEGGPSGMMPPGMSGPGADVVGPPHVELTAEEKKWAVVYPIYFDAKQRFEKGCRRVKYDDACLWPKSEAIEKAAQRLTLLHAHEPRKTHPRDWKNPGRVRIRLFDEDGKPLNRNVPNKKALLRAIAGIIQPDCGGKPPALEKTIAKTQEPRKPKARGASKAAAASATLLGGKSGQKQAPASTPVEQPINKNANAKSKSKPRHRSPMRVRPEARIKGTQQPRGLTRYPVYSPNNEAGMLNADMGSMMGGLQGMGPLGAMMGQMGLGGGDDDDEEDAGEAKDDGVAAKKAKDPMQQLNRKQRKRVIRIGR